MNKQSNSYTILYAVGLVLVVGLALSAVYQTLRPAQQENIDDDTRSQILKAALLTAPEGVPMSDFFAEHVKKSYIVNYNGAIVDKNADAAFDATLHMSQESKKPENERKLPVFECSTEKGLKYILPVYGQGLWGPIWGYVAFDADGETIYGAYFAHRQGVGTLRERRHNHQLGRADHARQEPPPLREIPGESPQLLGCQVKENRSTKTLN